MSKNIFVTQKRKSIRLKWYDYSKNGIYFITICTADYKSLFGEIYGNNMRLNDFGKIADQEWIKSGYIRKGIYLDQFVIIPNHLPGLIVIDKENNDPDFILQNKKSKKRSQSIPSIINGFKALMTKRITQNKNIKVWQRNYYERVIRSDLELHFVREYIQNNPINWHQDRLYISSDNDNVA